LSEGKRGEDCEILVQCRKQGSHGLGSLHPERIYYIYSETSVDLLTPSRIYLQFFLINPAKI
jgi:hypothetical protein